MRRSILLVLLCVAAAASCAKKETVAPPARERVGQTITHRVTAGETWESLARDYYGNPTRAGELAADNGGEPARPPVEGSAVRVLLTDRELRYVRNRLDAAREYNAGLDLVASGNYAEAAGRFEAAVELNPYFADASFNLAVAYQKLGYHAKAIDILDELVALSPRNVEYLYALGVSRFAGADYSAAKKAWGDALAIDPAHRKAVFSLGVLCEKTGKKDEARNRFEQYLRLDPNGEWADAARSHLEALGRPRR